MCGTHPIHVFLYLCCCPMCPVRLPVARRVGLARLWLEAEPKHGRRMPTLVHLVLLTVN